MKKLRVIMTVVAVLIAVGGTITTASSKSSMLGPEFVTVFSITEPITCESMLSCTNTGSPICQYMGRNLYLKYNPGPPYYQCKMLARGVWFNETVE